MSEKPTGISKLRINADGIEIEAEGENLDVPGMMARMTEMRRALGPMPTSLPQVGGGRAAGEPGPKSGDAPTISTNTIASLINAGTGSDLVMAAMAQITIVQRKDVAGRREILDEMRGAKTFYRETYSNNLSKYLHSLSKGKRLNLVGKETYALPNAERQNFERLIANAG
jgi:hypothetical protein